MERALEAVEELQDLLSYAHCHAEHFASQRGLGRTGVTGFLLGSALGFHLALLLALLLSGASSVFATALVRWSAYVVVLCTFHFMEFFSTSLNQPSTLTGDSFLVNHSTNYTIAALCSWTEFWLETVFLGSWKFNPWVTALGLVLAVGGQTVRSLAMFHCGDNFSHQIAVQKACDHRLVTEGVYRFLRHPSYLGWFYWSIGTQVILCNPLCALAYTAVSWRFFKERIVFEEKMLLEFFGDEYRAYARRSYIGIPFI